MEPCGRIRGSVEPVAQMQEHGPDGRPESRPHLAPVVPNNVVRFPESIPRRLQRQWPSLSVQALVLLSVSAIAIDFRASVWLLAVAVALAFGLRLTLPKRRVGWLEVRRRRTDLVCLGALLFCVVLVAVLTPTTI